MEPRREKFVVVGAGPVGAMAAMYAAERGHDVEVYEFRNDLRDPSTIPLNFTKSINLSLSERGINAIRHLKNPDLLKNVMTSTVPVRGRMIHGRSKSGTLFEEGQDYDIHGRTNFACDRGTLNSALLDSLEAMPNVKLFFGHKLVGADFKTRKAWIEKRIPGQPHPEEIEITFDLMIGADGAHSAVRYHMMKFTRMDYSQHYIDTLWCEFRIEPLVSKERKEGLNGLNEAEFAISPYHLHIWPGKDHMFIAIPSHDGSFTCTLFMPAAAYTSLDSSIKTNTAALTAFFDSNFPGVTALIPAQSLLESYTTNPHLPLISINASPYHFASSAVILGDAAHAMVPFYGQGMNCGLESVLTLFRLLDTHPTNRAAALAEYSALRAPDARAINKLALDNYTEMRSSVVSRWYKARKRFEEWVSVAWPGLGVKTKYSMVSFENVRYSEVIERSARQEKAIKWLLGGVGALPLVVAVVMLGWRWRSFFGATRWTVKKQLGKGWRWRGWL